MKPVKAVLLSAALLGATAPGPAQADGFGWGLGFGLLIGAPLLASSYYYRAYYPPYGYWGLATNFTYASWALVGRTEVALGQKRGSWFLLAPT